MSAKPDVVLKLSREEQCALDRETYANADKLIEPVLGIMFCFGLFLAFFYNTWFVALGVGGLCIVAYYATKVLLPKSNAYQYVTSALFAIFAAQYIYQMHGMAEMHFWVFIGATILILYQNWRLQLPLIIIVLVHHATFAYLQYIGYKEVYFTQSDYMDLTAFLFHGVLASCVCVVAGVWGQTFHNRTISDALNYKEIVMMKAQLEKNSLTTLELNEELLVSNERILEKNEELLASEEELRSVNDNLNELVEERTQQLVAQNKTLLHHSFTHGHKVRSPLARILGLVNLINHEVELREEGKDLLRHLNKSADELDEILREVSANLDNAEFKED